MRRLLRGFTLAEAMLAIMFISIALFGYVSLHIRIIYSGTKLESRQAVHEQVAGDLNSQIVNTRDNGSGANTTTSNGTLNSNNTGGVYSKTGYNTGTSIPYIDESSTSTVPGLPPNLFQVKASMQWSDRNGQQSYLVDTYERQIKSGW